MGSSSEGGAGIDHRELGVLRMLSLEAERTAQAVTACMNANPPSPTKADGEEVYACWSCVSPSTTDHAVGCTERADKVKATEAL